MTSHWVTSSASSNLLTWKEPIGWPKACRSFAYSIVSSRICRAWARLLTAAPMRSVTSRSIMWMKPWSISPMHVVVGDAHVGEEELGGVGLRLTDLVELAAPSKPGHAGLDAEQGDAPRPFSGSVRAATMTRSAE